VGKLFGMEEIIKGKEFPVALTWYWFQMMAGRKELPQKFSLSANNAG